MATTYPGSEPRMDARERRRTQGRSQGRAQGKGGFKDRVKPALSVLAAFWTKANNDWLFNMAAMLAYNILMSVFPILLVLLAIGGLILGATGTSQQRLISAISGVLPNGAGQALLVNVTNNLHKNAGILLAIGIVVAVFTGSRLFITLESAFGVVFRLRSRNVIRQNLMAIGMLLLYAVLIPVILLASVIPATIVRALPIGTDNPIAGFFFQALGDVVAVFFAMVLFGAIYVVVPNRPVQLKEVWRGTLVAAVLLVLYETLFPLYISYFLKPGNYGSTAGFAVVILLFFYYLAVIILLGAEVNSWAAGQRQTAAPLGAMLHEMQAHNSTRGAAGPTAGSPQEDIEHHKGASAMDTERSAIEHERQDHSADAQPPKYAESGVSAIGYNVESQGSMRQLAGQSGGDPRATSRERHTIRDAVGEAKAAAQSIPSAAGEPAARAADHTADRPAATKKVTPTHPLTTPQKRALGAVVASGVVALAPVVAWVADRVRGEERPRALS